MEFDVSVNNTIGTTKNTQKEKKRKALYFVLNSKKENILNISIETTEDIEYETNNKIIDKWFCVSRIDDFKTFLINHPLLKNQKETYNISIQDYKQLIKITKKQHIFYIDSNDKPVCQSAGESVCQPAGESVCQPAGESVCQPAGESECQSAGESVCQPAGESVCQPAGESVYQPAGESVCQPAGESVCQPAGESVCQCQPVIKHININRGSKIQKYSINGELLKTYIGIRDATRQESISDTKLKAAIENKTIYIGDRWLFLDRELPDDTVQEIGISVEINTPKNAFVAMLDIDKSKIVEVYQNQKEASIARQLKSSSAIYKSITNGNLSSGHYFQYFEDCSENLKQAFFERGGTLPKFYINKGIVVKQINHVTNEVVKEFPSILDVQKHFQVSSKTIKKAIKTGEVLKGFKWSY